MCENFVSVVFSFKEKKEYSKKFDPAQPSKLVGFLSSFAYSSSKWKGKEKNGNFGIQNKIEKKKGKRKENTHTPNSRSQKLLALTFPMYPHKVEKNTHIHI
ncbi:hypothetical protein HBI24_217090 [Parastagonospora nodorum]|nr:hypothetical protein HBH82_215360 [Parastagonospora nodorum]KAH4665501.1 hypothetical protein HBH78_202790 [Parastagonospora nodorum]KAH4694547.1 hypothetical protein HBH67_211900 [Parastagonospora nodorum]KAH4760365.1 hypothetical protein HBH63_214230 [Parastagonospora nodorum]KAH4770745.1 hypothetical protein HBH62_216830 [Parastagonospora nodorum]